MRKKIIRFLATMSLLIFFFPFFQMCSDKTIKEESSFLRAYSTAKTEKEKNIAFQKAKKDFSLSGFDLAMAFEPIFYCFTVILMLNITIWVCVFRGHKKLIFLAFLNLVLILISFAVIVISFPILGQIRYGMYACLINASLLFYFIYKDQETAYNSGLTQ
ncbi:hypothetical protein [Flavobacterium sp.]|uniref:hypothetical protein n=1 Tax=Flavobacterium sp. TaxID=239 RepID=UPI0028BF10AB|nr:hypothetical protein [Flavobacterium sp.]